MPVLRFILTLRSPSARVAGQKIFARKGWRSRDAEVEADLQARDEYDSSREHSPLVESRDAIHVDTDHLAIPAVVDRLESLVHERWRQLGIEQG